MIPEERFAKSVSMPEIGPFATLRGLLQRSRPFGAVGGFLPAVFAGLVFSAAPALAVSVEAPETKAPTGVSSTSATFNGVLNPGMAGEAGEYRFKYAVSPSECLSGEGTSVERSTGAAKEAVSQEVSGLAPDTLYVVCAIAYGPPPAEERVVGPAVSFMTKAAPPVVSGEGVSGVKSTVATVEAQVNPENEPTSYTLEYSTQVSGEHLQGMIVKSSGGPLEGSGTVTVSALVESLEPGMTYYYRVVAENEQSKTEGKPVEGPVEQFTTVPAPVTEVPSPLAGSTATFKGHLGPLNANIAAQYSFEYSVGEECTSGNTTPVGEVGKAPGGEVSVSVPVSGLLARTQYTVCLLASNAYGSEQGAPVTFETPVAAPAILSEYPSSVEASSVILNAEIDPGAAATTYHFEYGTEAGVYDHSTPEASLAGVDNNEHLATAQIAGLTAGVTYHYRVVATNSESPQGGTPGPDRVFATSALETATAENCPNAKARGEQPYGLTLPDCRAYEMVSPLQKGDNGVSGESDSRAAVSGEAIAYYSPGSFDNPQSTLLQSLYISRRSPNGWTTQNTSPSYADYEENALHEPFGELLFSPTLSDGVVRSLQTPLVKNESVGYVNLYLANTEDGSYQAVSDFTPEEEYRPFEVRLFVEAPQAEGGSTDLSHVVFQQFRKGGEGSPAEEHVYEWAGGEPSLVDVPPPGVKFEGQDNVGASATADEPLVFGNTWHAVSADGARVFFTGQESPDIKYVGQLFVRENPLALQSPYVEGKCAVSADACTVEVSASQRSEPDPNASKAPWAFYRGASADGSRVFFTSRVELTDDADTGPEDNAANLYEYDLETGVLTDVTVLGTGAEEAESPEGAAVLGLVTASEDGSYVYFVANGVLAEGAKPGNCKKERSGEAVVARERSCSLYVVHDGVGGWEAPRFIATLAGSNAEPFTFGGSRDGDEADWVGYEDPEYDYGPGSHTARVTPDGTSLAFESELSLTGYDNTPAESAKPGVCGEHDRCLEVYLYNVTTGRLVCTSCDPSGARPTGPAQLGGHGEDVFYLPSNLSEDGGRLFFQSPDALVPNDSNGKLDVYEWERPATAAEVERGESSCTSASPDFHPDDEGCVVPISDVAGGNESRFMDASTNGDNVFIATADQLVPADTDSRADVYDVRVGGGFPVSTPAPVCTNADSCKPPVSPQPGVFAVPASATFSGPGNPTVPGLPPAVAKPVKKRAVKCKHNFVKKKIKKKEACVKKPRQKRKVKKSTRRAR